MSGQPVSEVGLSSSHIHAQYVDNQCNNIDVTSIKVSYYQWKELCGTEAALHRALCRLYHLRCLQRSVRKWF